MSILYELKNIEYFFDEKRVLSIDNLILEENKIIGFFGPNGSGKSTLFSILSFISKPQNGEIIIDENIKKSVVMLPQNPYLLKRTVFENIAYGLKIRGESVDCFVNVIFIFEFKDVISFIDSINIFFGIYRLFLRFDGIILS